MSYTEDQFHIKQTPHPTPTTPAKFCVQFWSLFYEQDHLVLSNSIR